MKLSLRAALAAGLLIAPVAASAMTVAEFLAKANALKAKGMLAMMSPDLPVVRGEIDSAFAGYRADADAARAKGNKALGCPPPKGQAKISSDEIMAGLAAMPPAAQTKMTVRAGITAFMAKRYPCK